MLISVVRRASTPRTLRRARTLVAGLAVVLVLFQLAAAGHRHDRRLDVRIDAPFGTHACGLCAALLDALPAPAGPPPLVADRGERWYAAPAAAVAVVPHGRPPMKPAGCGPPAAPVAARCLASGPPLTVFVFLP